MAPGGLVELDSSSVITLNVTYLSLVRCWDQEELQCLLDEVVCPVCDRKGLLRLTKRKLHRGVVRPDGEGRLIPEEMRVPLVRCDGGGTRHWHRVLPCEIQRLKTYSTPSMELTMRHYRGGKVGLRAAVKALPKPGQAPDGKPVVRPNYTTLWRWLGGVGQYGRGRETRAGALPFGVVRRETVRHGYPQLPEVWRCRVEVPEERHQPGPRGEELEYALRVLRTASALFPKEAFPVTAWSGLMLGFGFVMALGWWTAKVKTRIQLPLPEDGLVGFPSAPKPPRKEERCPTRTRSPPGASSRSPF